MKRHLGCLCACIFDVLSAHSKATQTCNSYHVTMISFDHGGQEFLNGAEVSKNIDAENLLKVFIGLIKNRDVHGFGCVVDQNSGKAMGMTDVFGDFIKLVGRGEVHLIEKYILGWIWLDDTIIERRPYSILYCQVVQDPQYQA